MSSKTGYARQCPSHTTHSCGLGPWFQPGPKAGAPVGARQPGPAWRRGVVGSESPAQLSRHYLDNWAEPSASGQYLVGWLNQGTKYPLSAALTELQTPEVTEQLRVSPECKGVGTCAATSFTGGPVPGAQAVHTWILNRTIGCSESTLFADISNADNGPFGKLGLFLAGFECRRFGYSKPA